MPDALAYCKRAVKNPSPRPLPEQNLARLLVRLEVVLLAAGDVERKSALHGRTRRRRVEPAREMRELGDLLPVALPAPRPADAGDVGDRVGAGEKFSIGEPL